MTNPAAETINKTNADTMAKTTQTAKKIGEAAAADLSDAEHETEANLKKGAAALSEAGHSSVAAFQQLAEAYQQIANKNSARLSESIKELGAIKTPIEFVELQQKLVKQAFETALADSRQIADITVSAFTTAFEPMQQQVAAAHHAVSR
jgi:phasin family protein